MALKDKKHWSAKSDLKHDEVKDAVEAIFDWILGNRAQAAGILAGVVAAAVVIGVIVYSRRAREGAAWDKLSQAESSADAGRASDAQALIGQIETEGGSASAAALARLLDGDMHYLRAEYDPAAASFKQAEDASPEPLKTFALADEVAAYEAAGKADQCVRAAQSFLDAHAGDILAPQVHTSLARCQFAEGQADAAKASLQKIGLLYQNTPWAEWAAARLAVAAAAK
jgi:predicted negative regulator of RcsB-dependent stress response